MNVVQFEPSHLFLLEPQAAQADALEGMDPQTAKALAATPAISVVDGPYVLGCGGILPVWDGRGTGWVFLGKQASRYMRFITRVTRRFIEEHAPTRLEMFVDLKFDAGHRWAKLLGFEVEVPVAKSYLPNGNDATLYVRFKR